MPKKPTKADITAELFATRSELCRAEASIEAISANNDALREELRVTKSALDALSVEYIELQDKLANHFRDAKLITSRGELIAKLRQLMRDGVPCIMRGDFIYHSYTKAILAQVGAPQ